jgi:hypothetical protein
MAMALATTGTGLKLKHLYVTQIPKSGREPDDVLMALSLGQKQILASVG